VKLRIKGDSIRVRLTHGEIKSLATNGRIEEQLRFTPDRALIWRIAADAAATESGATFDGGVIEVRVPRRPLEHWCASGEVTFAATQKQGDVELRILIERDLGG
jgi:hypothetical protein